MPVPASGVKGSATAIHEWIRSLPGLHIANDKRISIGGLAGFEVDLSIDPKWTRNCGWEDPTGVPLFVNAQTTPEEGFDWGLAGDGRMRLFTLTLGRDRTLLIDIEAPDKQSWDSLLTDAVPIVQSFEFLH
jgi:hypothetical protein